MQHAFVAATLALALGMVGCRPGEANRSDTGAAVRDNPNAGGGRSAGDVSSIDPCALLTKEEVATQVDLTLEPDQREAKRKLNREAIQREGLRESDYPSGYAISTEEEMPGVSKSTRICKVSWRSADVRDGVPAYKGDFTVEVHAVDTPEVFGAIVGRNATPIPGVGDEAYFAGGGGNVPYARVGNVAVGVVSFPGKERSLTLLRAATGRLR